MSENNFEYFKNEISKDTDISAEFLILKYNEKKIDSQMPIINLISEDNSIIVVGKDINLDLEVPEYLAKLNLQNGHVFWM